MRLGQSPKLKAQPIPQMVMSARMLQMGSVDLERAIMRELEENPALELIEEESALSWGRDVGTIPSEDEERVDPLEETPADLTFEEYLLRQMLPHLRPEQLDIAQILVDSLDSHGLFTTTTAEVAELASSSPEQVEKVLAILQEQEPRGIGARSVQECLLLQLAALQEEGFAEGRVPKIAHTLISEHWEELGRSTSQRLATALREKVEEIEEALDFIRHNLNPFPAHAYSPRSEMTRSIRPDLIVRIGERGESEELAIDFPEENRYRFRINPLYQELASGRGEVSEEEKEYLRTYAERARLFVSSFEQRWRTLRQIVEMLVEEQRDFFRHGPRHLNPLTRAEVAQALGIHESTVSRAVADKYLELPQGRLIPLGDLFDGSLGIKDRIQEIIAQEASPLSDGQISSQLHKEGISVARRTVAKYREALGILPASLRRPRAKKRVG